MGKKARLRRLQGKSLVTLLRLLPGNGVGRLITRGSEIQVEGEPTYFRIMEVDMTPLNSKTKSVWKAKRIRLSKCVVQKTFRGVTIPKLSNINQISYLPDFSLVPKEEEHKYLNNTKTAAASGYLMTKADEDEDQPEDSEGGNCEKPVDNVTDSISQGSKSKAPIENNVDVTASKIRKISN